MTLCSISIKYDHRFKAKKSVLPSFCNTNGPKPNFLAYRELEFFFVSRDESGFASRSIVISKSFLKPLPSLFGLCLNLLLCFCVRWRYPSFLSIFFPFLIHGICIGSSRYLEPRVCLQFLLFFGVHLFYGLLFAFYSEESSYKNAPVLHSVSWVSHGTQKLTRIRSRHFDGATIREREMKYTLALRFATANIRRFFQVFFLCSASRTLSLVSERFVSCLPAPCLYGLAGKHEL